LHRVLRFASALFARRFQMHALRKPVYGPFNAPAGSGVASAEGSGKVGLGNKTGFSVVNSWISSSSTPADSWPNEWRSTQNAKNSGAMQASKTPVLMIAAAISGSRWRWWAIA
jgi:hypothetical protein